ncbi:MAG TPA: universal stress protein [Polyangia bacterium]|jgi:nucleotide-binding universal stress UspA family protein
MPLQHILVPVDFSPRSRHALRYALALAARWPASIQALHVVPPPLRLELAFDAWLGRPMPRTSQEAIDRAEEQLSLLITSLPIDDVVVRPRIEPGDPAATIVRVATEDALDLILIGTRARTGISEWLLGSVAKTVLSCAPCPVLTLRGDELGAHPPQERDQTLFGGR